MNCLQLYLEWLCFSSTDRLLCEAFAMCEKEFVSKRVPKIRLIWRFGLTQTMEMQIMRNPNCMFMPTYSIWFLVLLSCRRQQLKNYPQRCMHVFSMAQYANGIFSKCCSLLTISKSQLTYEIFTNIEDNFR